LANRRTDRRTDNTCNAAYEICRVESVALKILLESEFMNYYLLTVNCRNDSVTSVCRWFQYEFTE